VKIEFCIKLNIFKIKFLVYILVKFDISNIQFHQFFFFNLNRKIYIKLDIAIVVFYLIYKNPKPIRNWFTKPVQQSHLLCIVKFKPFHSILNSLIFSLPVVINAFYSYIS